MQHVNYSVMGLSPITSYIHLLSIIVLMECSFPWFLISPRNKYDCGFHVFGLVLLLDAKVSSLPLQKAVSMLDLNHLAFRCLCLLSCKNAGFGLCAGGFWVVLFPERGVLSLSSKKKWGIKPPCGGGGMGAYASFGFVLSMTSHAPYCHNSGSKYPGKQQIVHAHASQMVCTSDCVAMSVDCSKT